MKVKELLEWLARLDPEMEVIIPGEGGDFVPLQQVVLDWAALRGEAAELAYPNEAGLPVIRLVGPEGLDTAYYCNASPDDD
jgi:hypothetical protein